MRLHSYPSIYNLGHRAVADLLRGPVIVEEKVDGSQVLASDGELIAETSDALDAVRRKADPQYRLQRLWVTKKREEWRDAND